AVVEACSTRVIERIAAARASVEVARTSRARSINAAILRDVELVSGVRGQAGDVRRVANTGHRRTRTLSEARGAVLNIERARAERTVPAKAGSMSRGRGRQAGRRGAGRRRSAGDVCDPT